MMRRFLLTLLTFIAVAPGAATAQDILGDVMSVQNVRLEKPEIFQMKGGEESSARDVAVITVELKSIKRFLPGALNPPDVIVGGILAKPLADPAVTGRLAVMAPVPEGQPVDLTLVDNAVLPRKREDGSSGIRLRDDVDDRPTERVRVLFSRGPALNLPDLDTLRDRYLETDGRLQP